MSNACVHPPDSNADLQAKINKLEAELASLKQHQHPLSLFDDIYNFVHAEQKTARNRFISACNTMAKDCLDSSGVIAICEEEYNEAKEHYYTCNAILRQLEAYRQSADTPTDAPETPREACISPWLHAALYSMAKLEYDEVQRRLIFLPNKLGKPSVESIIAFSRENELLTERLDFLRRVLDELEAVDVGGETA